MFEKRRKRKALKKLQEDCPHEYHIVSTYKIDISDWHYSSSRLVTRHDMYCPKCDKTVYEVSEITANRELEKQKVRNNHKETY